MLTLEQVSKSYDGSAPVLDSIQFTMARKEFFYLVGGSGAGKTSLLRILATEERPTSGRVKLFGYDVGSVSRSTLQEIRRSIGYVPQSLRLISDLTALENVWMAADLAGRRVQKLGAKRRAQELLEVFGLGSKAAVPVRQLSGGELQRVAMARALVRNPELILADEPTGAQDRDHLWAVVEQLLKANASGASVILATHDREIVRRVRKRCAVLKAGKLQVEDGLCIF